MLLTNNFLKNDRKKRFSQTKNGYPFNLRDAFSSKKSTSVNHKPSSMKADKKALRLNTDYGEYENTHTTYIPSNSKVNKKNIVFQKKRENSDYLDPNQNKIGVHSTKNNPKGNLDLRLLFKNPKDSEGKIKGQKGKAANHPLLKFMNRKKDRFQSPYDKSLNRVGWSREHNRSVSKTKNSIGKPKISINIKKEVSLLKEKARQEEQSTVKTIKKRKQTEPTKNLSRYQVDEGAQSEEEFGLTEEEEETFGSRFPYGFEKMKLLGRGGFSLVWLGRHSKSGKQFAIKQIITKNTHQTHIKQIWFGTNFFTLGGVPKPEFSHFPGIKNLVRMYSYEINQTDTWIFYEKCGSSLGSGLYDIKSQKLYGDQKLYKIYYRPLYQAISRNPKLLQTMVIEICKSLALLSDCQIVHSDLKTENILIKYDESKDFQIKEVKLIDYGSSFEFRNISQFSMATPEYMPPQILNYIIHQNEGEYEEQLYNEVMNNYKNPWTVDIWSLGCVLLEIVVGVPLWMSLPLLVPSKNGHSYLQKQGLFAVKGRLFPEIIAKQRKINEKLDHILEKQNYSRIELSPTMKQIIKQMLQIDFNKRISPKQIIEMLSK